MPSAVNRQLLLERGQCAMCGVEPHRPGRTNCAACAEMLQRRWRARTTRLHLVPHTREAATQLCCGWWTGSRTVLPWSCISCGRVVHR